LDSVSPHTASILSSIIRFEDLPARIQLSRSAIRARIKANDFPKPLVLGIRAVGWLASDIEAWLVSRPRASTTFLKDKADLVGK
jgi:prophage regulatory protein